MMGGGRENVGRCSHWAAHIICTLFIYQNVTFVLISMDVHTESTAYGRGFEEVESKDRGRPQE